MEAVVCSYSITCEKDLSINSLILNEQDNLLINIAIIHKGNPFK